jgi:hypothetical protein
VTGVDSAAPVAALFSAPAGFEAAWRVVHSTPGGTLDFSLLVRGAGEALDLVGVDDLGGTLFRVRVGPAGEELLQPSPFLAERLLTRTLAAGLAALLVPTPAAESQSVRFEDGVRGRRTRVAGREALHRAEPAARVDLGRAGRLEATLIVRAWREAPTRAPETILLTDGSGRCRFELRLLSWKDSGPP